MCGCMRWRGLVRVVMVREVLEAEARRRVRRARARGIIVVYLVWCVILRSEMQDSRALKM